MDIKRQKWVRNRPGFNNCKLIIFNHILNLFKLPYEGIRSSAESAFSIDDLQYSWHCLLKWFASNKISVLFHLSYSCQGANILSDLKHFTAPSSPIYNYYLHATQKSKWEMLKCEISTIVSIFLSDILIWKKHLVITSFVLGLPGKKGEAYSTHNSLLIRSRSPI